MVVLQRRSPSISLGTLEVQAPVPTYFVCPISLELMRDPVTLSSGQTFDRTSIEKWVDEGHSTCPVTRLPLSPDEELDPIPNHILRRMIQSWCDQNQSLGIQRIVTPRRPASAKDIPALVDAICDRASDPADSIQKLTNLLLLRPHRHRHHMIQSGLLPQLGKLLSKSCSASTTTMMMMSLGGANPLLTPWSSNAWSVVDQTLRLLDLLTEGNGHEDESVSVNAPTEELVVALASIANRSTRPEASSRQVSVRILARLQLSDAMKRKIGGIPGLMESLVEIIKDGGCAIKSLGLSLVLELCKACNKNRVLAADAQVVALVVGLLKGGSLDKHTMELGLRVLEIVCHCAEGRAATSSHVDLVVKHMSGVSEHSSYLAVNILWFLIKSSPDSDKVKSAAYQHNALVKAVAIAQSAASLDTRLAARNIAASLLELMPTMPHTIRL
mgnify:CR=1 FL=1